MPYLSLSGTSPKIFDKAQIGVDFVIFHLNRGLFFVHSPLRRFMLIIENRAVANRKIWEQFAH